MTKQLRIGVGHEDFGVIGRRHHECPSCFYYKGHFWRYVAFDAKGNALEYAAVLERRDDVKPSIRVHMHYAYEEVSKIIGNNVVTAIKYAIIAGLLLTVYQCTATFATC